MKLRNQINKGFSMATQYAQVKFRVVPVNHEWLKEQAKKNRRSLTAELNFILDEKRKADEQIKTA